MKDKNNLMIISNGHGEDLISSYLIKSLIDKKNDINISVLPIVGKGNRFEKLPVEILGPRKVFPSGGVIRGSFKNLFNDIKSGLLVSTYKQIKEIRNNRDKVQLTIVIGDVYALLLSGLFSNSDIIFIPTAKSEYIDGHYKVEKYLMKKYAELVLPRDLKTTNNLINYGVNANFNGNLMMDCFEIDNIDFDLHSESNIIGLLPGSREESYDNMLDFIKVIEELEKLKKEKNVFLTPVVNDFSLEKLKNKLKNYKWNIIEESSDNDNTIMKIISPSKLNTINIIKNGFGDVLNQAKIFIGMAGTANEQAVGMGKPVITFPSSGVQFSFEFASNQKRLLGEGIKLIERDFKKVAYALVELLEDEKEYNKRSLSGKKRMGDKGAINKISNLIFKHLS